MCVWVCVREGERERRRQEVHCYFREIVVTYSEKKP